MARARFEVYGSTIIPAHPASCRNNATALSLFRTERKKECIFDTYVNIISPRLQDEKGAGTKRHHSCFYETQNTERRPSGRTAKKAGGGAKEKGIGRRDGGVIASIEPRFPCKSDSRQSVSQYCNQSINKSWLSLYTYIHPILH